MCRLLSVIFILLFGFVTVAQTDSIYHQLQEVEIRPFSQEAQLRLLSSEGIIQKEELAKQNQTSLLPAINNVPGVRMEERSPGSYRLSVRGSLLRSPFGVRNVKIYLGDFPFTDAGGNTYLNALDIDLINSLRILKGPEGSIFGANTGGVLLIDPVYKTPDSLKVIVSASAGSYGLVHQNFLIQKKIKNASFNLSQGYQRSDGYRLNSAMQRNYFQGSGTWNYRERSLLKFLLLFSDLNYQTPGGLTLEQFKSNPANARPATATLPGAAEQKAAVYNKLLFGGISHQVDFTEHLSHHLSVFGTSSDFKNPFITNFEQRHENTFGARTYFEVKNSPGKKILLKWNLGGEWQQTNSQISNYGNTGGAKTFIMASDNINAQQAFLFTRFLADINGRLLMEASLSYNTFFYDYKNTYPDTARTFNRKKFTPQLLPRIAVSYKLNDYFVWRASVSGGYSSPTIAEVRPSNLVVNTALQAENGVSYETGFRIRDKRDFLWIDVTAFYYHLHHAIVRRLDENGNDYYINAGGTYQPGVEGHIGLWIVKPNATRFLRSLKMEGNATYNQFTFTNYKVAGDDYSNNKVTGVPAYTSSENISMSFPYKLSFYAQYYYCSEIPLNDANTAYANAYHLVQAKISWEQSFKLFTLTVFAGADNLLNQKYSLGNDLNAVGGRYYNAAMPRNYYGGLKVEF